MSRGKIIAAVVALVVVALVVAAVLASARSRTPEVTAAEVTRGPLTQTVTASGQLEGDVKADVFPPAAQSQLTIRSIEVADGAEVKAGQLLATLDPEPLDVAVASAEANLAQARAGLVAAQRQAPSSAQRRAADVAVSSAASSLHNAEDARDIAIDQRDTAEANRDRDNDLSDAALAAGDTTGAATFAQAASGEQAKVDSLNLQIPGLRSQVAQANSALAQARAARDAIKNADAAIASAASGVNAAAEALELARQNRARANLTAPIDGVVVFAGGGGAAAAAGGAAGALGGGGKPTVGGTVSAASAPFSVYQLGALNFNAQVDEADISAVAVGQKASVTLDAFAGETFESKVVEIKTQAISTSTGGTAFPVLIAVKSAGKRLLVGMGGNADIEVSGIEDAVTVPVEALIDESGGTFVFVVDNANVLHKTKVKTGVTTDTRAQILSGVQPGQRVAIGGLSNLKDGTTVRVK